MTRQEIIAVMARAILDRSPGAMDKQACRADAAAALSAIHDANHVVVPITLLIEARNGLYVHASGINGPCSVTIGRLDTIIFAKSKEYRHD